MRKEMIEADMRIFISAGDDEATPENVEELLLEEIPLEGFDVIQRVTDEYEGSYEARATVFADGYEELSRKTCLVEKRINNILGRVFENTTAFLFDL